MKQQNIIQRLMGATLLFLALMLPTAAWADGTKPSGSGTTNDPYQITSADELIWFRDAVNGTNTGTGTGTGICAKVTADFQVENQNWAGIGTSSKKYTGTFDGNNKTIYIKHLSATGDNFGLFGYINGATIKDLTIAPPNNGNSYVFTSSYNNVGTVVGRADGASKILNVKSSIDLTISGAKSHIGGIVGYIQNTTQVSGCTYSGTINAGSSKDCIGGIVGFSYKDYATTITNCFFSGSITTTASDGSTWPDNYVLMGGILGYVNDETTNGTFGGVKNCFSAGTLTAESATKRKGIGAIIGAPRGKAIHDNNVTGNYYINGTTALGNNIADNATNKKITISVTSDNGNYGTVSTSYVNPTANANTLLQVTATPADHYHFGSWSDSGNQTHSVELTNDINLTASFAIDRHTITLAKNYAYRSKVYINGTESTGGTYDYGTQLTIKAVPDTYCYFGSWKNSDTNVSSEAEFNYIVTGDATLTAICFKTEYTFSLLSNNAQWGTAVVKSGVTNDGKCDAYTAVTITATPAEHYHFVSWSDGQGNTYTTAQPGEGNTCTTDANGVNTLVIGEGNITQNTTYTAHFAGNEYTITLNPTTNGTISQSSATGKYTYPAQVTLTATPAEHYHFVNWSDGQGNTYTTAQPGEGNTCTTDANGVNTLQVPVTANQTYTATFAIDRHQVTAVPNDAAYGSVEISNKADDNTYDYGTNLILTATPASNMYRFVGWKLNGNTVSTNASYPITVSGDSAYTAEFEYCLNIVNNVLMGWNSNWPEAQRPTSITIPEGVTSIYYSAFNGCTNLQSVTFPASIKSMGLSVFKGCTNLSSVNVAEGCQLTTFAERTFEGCTSLSSITIPASVTSIDQYAFMNCSNLSSITIPASVTTIGQYTFDNCSSLSSVTFADASRLGSIGNYAFQNCTSLSSITIPDSVTTIGYEAFKMCTSLSSVTFAENSRLTTIGGEVFMKCSNLSSITIPDSVTTIVQSAFNGCTSLSSITIPASVTTIGDYVF